VDVTNHMTVAVLVNVLNFFAPSYLIAI